MKRLLVLGIFSLFAASSANATLIFDNGSNTTNSGGYCSTCTGEFRVFDDLTFTSGATIGQVEFDASFFDASLIDDFDITVTFWDSINGTVLNEQVIGLDNASASYTQNTSGSNGNFTVLLDLVDFSLSTGTHYLSLAGTNSGASSYYMAFATSDLNGGTSGQQCYMNGSSCWNFSGNMPFRLYGANDTGVPAPAGIVILAIGLAGLVARRRKV